MPSLRSYNYPALHTIWSNTLTIIINFHFPSVINIRRTVRGQELSSDGKRTTRRREIIFTVIGPCLDWDCRNNVFILTCSTGCVYHSVPYNNRRPVFAKQEGLAICAKSSEFQNLEKWTCHQYFKLFNFNILQLWTLQHYLWGKMLCTMQCTDH